MPIFPRNPGALPRLASPPTFPSGLQSWGQSGKAQSRSVGNMGRVWTETYGLLDLANPYVRGLIQAINQSRRDGILWDVQHPYWHVRKGVGGGSPLVMGNAQTGSNLVVDGTFVNSLLNPRQMDLSPYVSAGGTPVITANDAIAPDGSLTATKINDDDAVTTERWGQSVTVPNDGATHLAGSFLRKRAGAPVAVPAWMRFQTGGTQLDIEIFVDPANGASIKTASASAGGVIDYNKDWWFCWVAGANNATGNTILFAEFAPAARAPGNVSAAAFDATQLGFNHFWGARVQLNTSSPFDPNWLRRGDLLQLPTSPVIFDVAGDVPATGDPVTIPISPPIFVGQSPADNAAVGIDPALMFFKAMLVDIQDFPNMDVTRFIDPGMQLTWREQPQ